MELIDKHGNKINCSAEEYKLIFEDRPTLTKQKRNFKEHYTPTDAEVIETVRQHGPMKMMAVLQKLGASKCGSNYLHFRKLLANDKRIIVSGKQQKTYEYTVVDQNNFGIIEKTIIIKEPIKYRRTLAKLQKSDKIVKTLETHGPMQMSELLDQLGVSRCGYNYKRIGKILDNDGRVTSETIGDSHILYSHNGIDKSNFGTIVKPKIEMSTREEIPKKKFGMSKASKQAASDRLVTVHAMAKRIRNKSKKARGKTISYPKAISIASEKYEAKKKR